MAKNFVLFSVNMAAPFKPIEAPMASAQRESLLSALGPVLASLMVIALLRKWRRQRRPAPPAADGTTRGTLLTMMRVSRSRKSNTVKEVAEVVLKPIERAMQPWLEGPRSAICDYNLFRVGDRVANACGLEGTIVGIDSDGDLPVFLQNEDTKIFYAKKCTKVLSIGDRFRHKNGEIAEVVNFDAADDPVVLKSNGLRTIWLRSWGERLPSVGDRVQYACKTMATITGFDEDGDFKVERPDGKAVVWYADKSTVSTGPLHPWPAIAIEP